MNNPHYCGYTKNLLLRLGAQLETIPPPHCRSISTLLCNDSHDALECGL